MLIDELCRIRCGQDELWYDVCLRSRPRCASICRASQSVFSCASRWESGVHRTTCSPPDTSSLVPPFGWQPRDIVLDAAGSHVGACPWRGASAHKPLGCGRKMPASARSLATITPFTMPAMTNERHERGRASAMRMPTINITQRAAALSSLSSLPSTAEGAPTSTSRVN